MKSLIVFALVGIVAALASAGVLMLRHGRDPRSDGAPDRRMARALALRVGISVALFLWVMLSWLMGWVKPGGLPIGS